MRPHRVGCTKALGRGYDILCGGCGDEVATTLAGTLQGKLYNARAALVTADEALQQVWAAIGDRLLGKGPLSKAYANAVERKVTEARAALRRVLESR